MISVLSVQGAVLVVMVSGAALSVVSLLCLWCKKRARLISEENQIYNPHIFHRDGSIFAVRRSKTVTRPNQIQRELPPTPPEDSYLERHETSQVDSGQPMYLNFQGADMGIREPTYVDPIPGEVYQNVDITVHAEQKTDSDPDQCPYENVCPPSTISDAITHHSDGSDYENFDFLEQVKREEEEEPDYVNAPEA